MPKIEIDRDVLKTLIAAAEVELESERLSRWTADDERLTGDLSAAIEAAKQTLEV